MTTTTLTETPTEVSTNTPTKAKRVRTGCLTCRERHLKCDEAVPDCVNCRKSNRTCKRGMRLNFLEVSVHKPIWVPSPAQWEVQFEDESRDIASEYKGGLSRYAPYDPEPATPQQTESAAFTWPGTPHRQLGVSNEVDFESRLDLNGNKDTDTTATPTSLRRMSPYSANFLTCQTDLFDTNHRDPFSQSDCTTPLYQAAIYSRRDEPPYAASLQEQQLMAVKERAAYQARRKSDASSATSIVPQATNAPQSFANHYNGGMSPDESTPVSSSEKAKNGEREFLSSPEEIYYMQVFVDKVGIWMDLFDRDKHFSRLIPYHALKSTMLLNAFLACGVKHLSLFSPDNEDKALFYYNTATTQLLRSLQNPDRNTAECATAAVLLNVYEIMSEKPAQRMNHIAGARALIRECGWDARSTGIGSACFWLNIGMEVLSCLSMDWQTTWDPEEWGLDINFPPEEDGDTGIGQEEVWVHRIFYIIAKTVNFRAAAPGNHNTANTLEDLRLSTRIAQWKELTQLCDGWINGCPRTMHPLGYLRPSKAWAKSAFPQVWYARAPCALK
ncbi:Fc.00g085140.m01.CDS01 [Cosmosporella sp. VM-42]